MPRKSMAKIGKFLSIPVMAVFLLMCFVYYSTIFVFTEELVSLKSTLGMSNALAFSFSASMCFVSFVSSVVTDPGFVPATYVPEVEDGGFEDPELKKSYKLSESDHEMMQWYHFGTAKLLADNRGKKVLTLDTVINVQHTNLPELIIAGSAKGSSLLGIEMESPEDFLCECFSLSLDFVYHIDFLTLDQAMMIEESFLSYLIAADKFFCYDS
ncbi:hypothetical protein Syun_016278 [Stephania yunnanensis]|uniref:Uncharacterized protein n=1 Tax=Stephania yunnanensis TaxID=152371 RepID=A0AAP0P4Q8_9MAGN